jgi:acyl carrier protein phosphodiesterase
VNFFGHAIVAGWSGQEAGGVLGSMLPDFEGMVKVPLLAIHDPAIARGVALHHRTDDVFHRTPVFLDLCALAVTELTRRGVRRGTARAVAHVGSEMFLDGWLARDDSLPSHYVEALYPDLADHLEWADRGAAFAALRKRLVRWGAPSDYREPAFVLQRLHDVLQSRPRLRVLDHQSAGLESFLPVFRRAVESQAPELLSQVRDALGLAS